jgi:hypothetical protein
MQAAVRRARMMWPSLSWRRSRRGLAPWEWRVR